MNSNNCNSIINQNKTLQQQNNQLLDQVNQATQAQSLIQCDSKCQYNKQANSLKQKYIDSQNNLATAPYQEQTAKKNYLVYTEGEVAYNEMMTEQYTAEADAAAAQYKTAFENASQDIEDKIQAYDTLLLSYNNSLELYNNYLQENEDLAKQLESESSDIITNNRKTYYQDQGIDTLNFIYYYVLRVVYIIVFICFTVFAFAYNSTLNSNKKIAITVALFILPFISTRILQFIISMITKIYNILPRNAYTKM